VDFTLVLSALLMGLAGSVHCVAMCGAPSAAVVRSCAGARPWGSRLGFLAGRLVGYTLAGGLVASSVAVLAQLGQWSPALRPLWTMAHLASLVLGLWLLWQGRQPAWMDNLGREGARPNNDHGTWQRVRGPVRAVGIGSLWVAWPCGLLQSALMVAALANSPTSGALVMAAFALASSPALGLAPALWLKLVSGDAGRGNRITTWITRLSGAALAAAAAWALGHDLWVRIAAYCFS
jgi:hypothetical protein